MGDSMTPAAMHYSWWLWKGSDDAGNRSAWYRAWQVVDRQIEESIKGYMDGGAR
jgi:hypothetical protein